MKPKYTLYDDVFTDGIVVTGNELVRYMARCLERGELSPELRIEPYKEPVK